MGSSLPFAHRLWISAIFAALLAVAGCGASANTSTSPSSVSKCALTVGGLGSTLPASGATATLTVTAARECQWTASTDADWLTVNGERSGQGDGALQLN